MSECGDMLSRGDAPVYHLEQRLFSTFRLGLSSGWIKQGVCAMCNVTSELLIPTSSWTKMDKLNGIKQTQGGEGTKNHQANNDMANNRISKITSRIGGPAKKENTKESRQEKPTGSRPEHRRKLPQRRSSGCLGCWRTHRLLDHPMFSMLRLRPPS